MFPHVILFAFGILDVHIFRRFEVPWGDPPQTLKLGCHFILLVLPNGNALAGRYDRRDDAYQPAKDNNHLCIEPCKILS